MRSKQRWTVLIVLAAVAVIAGFKTFSNFFHKPIDSVAARSKGDPQAKVQIIEFIDFECPACATGAQTLKEQMAKHPQDIRVQVKYFPLIRPHPHAMQVAAYSECAGRQGKFWEFQDLLLPQQKQWSVLLSAEPMFQNMAREIGLDMGRLAKCVAAPETARAIHEDQALGKSLGVQSTPTYFVNNKMIVGGKSLTDELNTHFPPSQ
ncbi:MAG: DsbA family protein [Candidatus Omnitrophica bacterium]|nr:DsbA family protein [Candidatus Omnitrophota bacterium]